MNLVTTLKLSKRDIERIGIRARMCVASERKWKSLHQDNARPDIKFDGARLEDGFRPNKIKVYRKSNPSASIFIIPSDRMLSSTRGVITFAIFTSSKHSILSRISERVWIGAWLKSQLKEKFENGEFKKRSTREKLIFLEKWKFRSRGVNYVMLIRICYSLLLCMPF